MPHLVRLWGGQHGAPRGPGWCSTHVQCLNAHYTSDYRAHWAPKAAGLHTVHPHKSTGGELTSPSHPPASLHLIPTTLDLHDSTPILVRPNEPSQPFQPFYLTRAIVRQHRRQYLRCFHRFIKSNKASAGLETTRQP